MTWFLEGAAFLCLIYYGVICVYSGAATSFALAWPALALFFTALALGLRAYGRHAASVPLWIPVSISTACGAVLAVILAPQPMKSSAARMTAKTAPQAVDMDTGIHSGTDAAWRP